MKRDEERVREALREADVPEEGQAEERGWRVVRATYAERDPAPRRRRSGPRSALALAAAGLVAAFALTPAGADVREWIADAFEPGAENARPLSSLPAPGALLVEADTGAWIVRDDGSRRRLGSFREADWSPNGINVAVAAGDEVRAVSPLGVVRWAQPTRRRVRAVAWSPGDGYRVAYLSGSELRVIAGDGTGDALAAPDVGSAAIAWRPASPTPHQLAFVDPDDRVTLMDTDSGEVLWRSGEHTAPVRSLQWSNDGERLLVVADEFALLRNGEGDQVLKGPVGGVISRATLSPDGKHVAVVRPNRKSGTEVALVLTQPGDRGERVLYATGAAAGDVRLGPPEFSPDGKWLLVPRPSAGQWLFIRIADRRQGVVADVARLFGLSGPGSPFPSVAGWCC